MSNHDQITDVREISRIAYGFMGSKALFTALDVNLFTVLASGPLSAQDMAARTSMTPGAAATLLSALGALGLVIRSGELWTNAPAAERYLVDGAPEAFGEYYRLQVDGLIYPMLQHLPAGVRGDRTGLAPGLAAAGMSDPDTAARFSRAQHAGSRGPAALLARRVDLTGARTLLDVAGGTGAMSIALCQAHPQLTATIVDFPNVVAVARDYVTSAGLSDRISFITGDALDVPWPPTDVVLMSYLLSAVAGPDIPVLLQRAAAVLQGQRGRLLVHDFMLDEDRLGPDLSALWFLQYLAERVDAVSFTTGELREQLERLSFTDVQDDVLLPEITRLLTATAGGS